MADYRLGALKGQWCVTWTEDGKRSRYRLGISLKRPKIEAEVRLREFVRVRQAAQVVRSGPLTVGDLFEAYKQSRAAEGKDVRRQTEIWSVIKGTFASIKPEDLDTKAFIIGGKELTICHRYAVDMDERGLASATIWDRLTTLRTAMNWAHKAKLIAVCPNVWAPSKGEPRDVVADESEVKAIIEACRSNHVRLFVMLAAGTGARKSAILELTWDRVDFERRLIDFRVRRKKNILDRSGKKGRAIVEFGGVLELALREAKEVARSEFVIEYAGGKVDDIKKALARAVERAGLQHRQIGAHAIRHSVATWLADESVEMRMIQKMLGHKDIKTTEQVYAKYRRGYLAGAANVIDMKLKGMR